jgi:hypothetical protein
MFTKMVSRERSNAKLVHVSEQWPLKCSCELSFRLRFPRRVSFPRRVELANASKPHRRPRPNRERNNCHRDGEYAEKQRIRDSLRELAWVDRFRFGQFAEGEHHSEHGPQHTRSNRQKNNDAKYQTQPSKANNRRIVCPGNRRRRCIWVRGRHLSPTNVHGHPDRAGDSLTAKPPSSRSRVHQLVRQFWSGERATIALSPCVRLYRPLGIKANLV